MQRVFVLDKEKQPLIPCNTVRTTGSFNITAKDGTNQGIGYQYCRLLQKNDGYQYSNLSNVIAEKKTTHVSLPPRAEARGLQ